jgi:response regulator of citrate/malate metabolism
MTENSKKINCVLLIDDDGTTNFINYRIVKKLNITDHIQTEYNGEKALNFIQHYSEKNNSDSPELIILDLKMPVLNGFEFLDYWKLKKFSNKENVKIFVLTTSNHSDELEQLKKKYEIEYVNKPLTEKKLQEMTGIKPAGKKVNAAKNKS